MNYLGNSTTIILFILCSILSIYSIINYFRLDWWFNKNGCSEDIDKQNVHRPEVISFAISLIFFAIVFTYVVYKLFIIKKNK